MVYEAKIKKKMLKMSSTCINASTDISDNGMSHPFKGPREVLNGMTGIESVMAKCLFIFNWS
jgi:hypothetical protein